MRTVYKYQIEREDITNTEIPKDAVIIHAAMQGGELCIWAIVDPKASLASRKFIAIGTGQILPDHQLTHITTVHDRPYVWHVFEIIKEEEQEPKL